MDPRSILALPDVGPAIAVALVGAAVVLAVLLLFALARGKI